MDNKVKVSTGGINLLHILTIVFVVLKLCNVISWSWFFVLLPSIISVTLTLIIFVIAIIILIVANKRGY